MQYYSTNRHSPPVSFRDAAINGQAPDTGLYFPEYIPQVPEALIRNIKTYSREELAFRVMQPYVGNSMPEPVLKQILAETLNFPIPLIHLGHNCWCLELFHGPTLAFKDVGARFMSRCLSYFLRDEKRTVTILVATSGDTGGAVAHGFYKVPGVEVCILYPKGMVSPVQEKQLTTLGENIRALEVNGSFDDCQRMVKQAFADPDLQKGLFLSSANSINVARWLPQQLYYFFALQQWPAEMEPPVVAVPSGNFGNICAGILARESGLPIRHFIAACNKNDMVADYFKTGQWQPRPAEATLSNAMDVGNPSNFVRILEITGHQMPVLKSMLSADTVTDADTLDAIREMWSEFSYLADPHGAVAYRALRRYLQNHPGQAGIFLETAHPVKFPDAIKQAVQQEVKVPPGLLPLLKQTKKATAIEAQYGKLKEILVGRGER
ncbi:MAG: threonine synthase [Chitinophagaceae bacterium]